MDVMKLLFEEKMEEQTKSDKEKILEEFYRYRNKSPLAKIYKKYDKVYNKQYNKIRIITYILTTITMILLFVFVIWVFVLNKNISREMYSQIVSFSEFLLMPLGVVTLLFWFIYTRDWGSNWT